MSSDLIKQKSWLQLHWKWILPTFIIIILTATLFFSLTAGHLGDFGQAYTEPELYEGALEIAQKNKDVKKLLGNIEPITKMAILEGDIEYSNQNTNVQFAVRVQGNSGKAIMEVTAAHANDIWEYKAITIRIKNPPEKRQTISVLE